MSARCLCEPLEPRRLLTRLGVIGDFSSDVRTAPTRDVANLVKGWNPDAIVTAGDNNYPDGAASTIDANVGQWYHDYISPYTGSFGAGSPSGNRFWPSIGNHDYNSSAGFTPYLNYFTLPGNERYYSVTIGDIAVFVVNSDSHEPDGMTAGSVQYNWLKGQMQSSTARWKLVVFHEPAYSSGGIGSNTAMRWPFAQWGATAVISGHDHDYERLLEGGLTYFVDGLGGESIVGFGSTIAGSQVRYAGDYGAMQINSSDTAIEFTFITRTGTVIDDYTINYVPPPPPPLPTINSTVIPAGATWKYLDNGTNQGTAWRTLGFGDSSWSAGPAQLGYGDGDEATVVSYGPNANNKYITTYFRNSFNIADPSAISALNLGILRDDGAVVYLNGTEVFRTNMPGGTITYTTLASAAIEDNTFYPSSVAPSLLVAGNNVIAVEIHQSGKNSSDISFDFFLTASTPTAWKSGSTLNLRFDGSTTPLTLAGDGTAGDVIVSRANAMQTFTGVTAIAALGSSASDLLQIDGPLSAGLTLVSGGGSDSVRLMAGSYTFANDLSPSSHNVALTIDTGATASFNSSQHLSSLTVNGSASLTPGGDKVIRTGALAVTGRLDVADDALIVDYSSVSPVGTWTGSAYDGISGLIASGRNGGPAGGNLWDGSGIVTSAATQGNFTTLGVAEASQALNLSGSETAIFRGETVDAFAVLVRYTYGGDANLDGKIDVDDYGRIDLNIPLGSSGWFNGDFNFDGKIDVDDYGIIDFNVGVQGPPL